MDDKAKLPAIHDENFREYRKHPKFRGIDSEKAQKTYSAFGKILSWAESILWYCKSDEIVALSEQTEREISVHQNAIVLGERETPFQYDGAMDATRKQFLLGEASRYYFLKHIDSPNSMDQIFEFDYWAKLFAVFALTNLADAARNHDLERADIVTSSNAVIGAMEAVTFGQALQNSGFWARQEQTRASARRSSSGKRLIGATQRQRIVKEERAKLQAEISATLSAAGVLGGMARRNRYEPIKKWALEKAGNMRGADKQIASRLSAELPKHLADISGDPQRLIYDTLRARATPK